MALCCGARVTAFWKDASLEQMAHCPLLGPGKRNRLQATISLCSKPDLISKASERADRRAAALAAAHSWLETKLQRQNQTQATFMRNYANSMMSTAYRGPSNTVSAQGRGKASGAPHAKPQVKPQKAAKLSKADLIRQQQTAKKSLGNAAKFADKWRVKQQDLQRRVQVSGWDAQLQLEVDAFLQECKQAGAAYLQAALFKLEHSTDAWKQACLKQSRGRRTAKSTAGVASATATADLTLSAVLLASSPPPPRAAIAAAGKDSAPVPREAVPHAVSIWMTVQDLIAKKHLEAGASDTEAGKEAAKEAAKQCELALQLLGFQQAAAAVTKLLKAFQIKKPEKKSKGNTPATPPGERAGSAGAWPPSNKLDWVCCTALLTLNAVSHSDAVT